MVISGRSSSTVFLSLASKPLLALNSSAGYWGLIILMCWQQIGYMMIIYIAGLQSVPSDLVEAAEIDGANTWDVLWKIKLPMVMSSVTICVFLTLTNSFKLFDQNLALTGGDPNHSTEMLVPEHLPDLLRTCRRALQGLRSGKSCYVLYFSHCDFHASAEAYQI